MIFCTQNLTNRREMKSKQLKLLVSLVGAALVALAMLMPSAFGATFAKGYESFAGILRQPRRRARESAPESTRRSHRPDRLDLAF
jgi:hypothetical protein